MVERIKNEPVLLYAFIISVINLSLAFGLKLTPEQLAAIETVVVAGLAIVFRNFTTPVRNK